MHFDEAFIDLSPNFSISRGKDHVLISNLLLEVSAVKFFFLRECNVISEIVMVEVVIMNISSSVFSIFTKIDKNIS